METRRPRGINFLNWTISDPNVGANVFFPVAGGATFTTADQGRHARKVILRNEHSGSVNIRIFGPMTPSGASYVLLSMPAGTEFTIPGTVTHMALMTTNSGGPVHCLAEFD